MALAADIMRGGTSAGQAQAINGQVSPTVTASGTTIADAFDLIASINVLTTVASGTGVQLPSGMIGDQVEILNLGANTVTVYPDSSTTRINQLTAGTGFSLGINTAVKLRKFSSTRWIAWLSA